MASLWMNSPSRPAAPAYALRDSGWASRRESRTARRSIPTIWFRVEGSELILYISARVKSQSHTFTYLDEKTGKEWGWMLLR